MLADPSRQGLFRDASFGNREYLLFSIFFRGVQIAAVEAKHEEDCREGDPLVAVDEWVTVAADGKTKRSGDVGEALGIVGIGQDLTGARQRGIQGRLVSNAR